MCAAVVVLAGCIAASNADPSPLPALNINTSTITISGISSGADFAVQFHVAFSSTIKGVGVFAGQPYHCAVTRFEDDPLVPPDPHIPVPCTTCPPNATLQYDHCKAHPERVQAKLLHEYARQQVEAGTIDDTSNLAEHPVYLYRGTMDPCYLPGSEGRVIDFYRGFISGRDGQFALESTIPSKHVQPTIHQGAPCAGPYDGPYSYLASCGYDGAGAALTHLYRRQTLKPPVKSANWKYLRRIPQAHYMHGRDIGLAKEAYIFVPPRCAAGHMCQLHVWFHGCGGPDRFYNASVHYAGFNEWAETNDLVVLYPAMRNWGQTEETQMGCWDGYGQTGPDYALKSGGQMSAVMRMIEDIAGMNELPAVTVQVSTSLPQQHVTAHDPRTVAPSVTGEAFSGVRLARATPAVLYNFENVHDLTIDAQGLCNLTASGSTTPHGQIQSIHSVGNFAVFSAAAAVVAAGSRLSWKAQSCAPRAHSKGLTIEFLLHPTPQCFLRGGSATLVGGPPGAPSATLTHDGLAFTAKTTEDVADDDGVLQIKFDGEGVLAADYLWGKADPHGAWHHVALVRDAMTGDQSVWIDGECQPSMRRNGTSSAATATAARREKIGGGGDAPRHEMASAGLSIDWNNPVALCAGLDEVAIHETALTPSLIYAHFLQAINQSVPYQPDDPGGRVPTTRYPDGDNVSYYDLSEYVKGTVLPSPGGHAHPPSPGGGGNTTLCDGCMTCVDQVRFAPDPRFGAAALTKYKTPYNFNWMDPTHYMTDPFLPRPIKANMTLDLLEQLATRWRYGYQLIKSSDGKNASIDVANAHPEWPLHATIPGERGQLFNASLPPGCYMQDAHGHFITVLGDRIPAGEPPTLRPMSAKTAAAQGCPDSLFNAFGDVTRSKYGFEALAQAGRLKRGFDIVNSDGEVFIGIMSHRTPPAPAEHYDYSKDAVSAADFAASGQPNWLSFFSEWRVRLTNGWSERILSPLRNSVFKGTRFTMYQVQGNNPYFGNWSITRKIGAPMHDAATGNMTYYSTVEPYFTSPHNWWQCSGAYHGVCWMQQVRPSERALGDELMSPFVSAGWSQQAERNVRPAQWLGLMKIFAAWGAEWFYPSFFSLRKPFQDSSNWCWQALMPVYAQAVVVTQAADLYYGGRLVTNDPNTSFAMGDDGTSGSPLLWAGAPHVLAMARKQGDHYLLVAAVQRLSNNARNLVASSRRSEVHIPGLAKPVVVNARLQGSVFIITNASSEHPTATQLDTWHEASHPTYWSQAATTYEAELFEGRFVVPPKAHDDDGTHPDSARRGVAHELMPGLVVTETPSTAAHTLDFATFTTYVDLRAATNDVCLRVHPAPPGPRGRKAVTRRRHVRVLARGGEVRLSGAAAATSSRGTWQWLEHDAWEMAEAGGLLCLEGSAHVDKVEITMPAV